MFLELSFGISSPIAILLPKVPLVAIQEFVSLSVHDKPLVWFFLFPFFYLGPTSLSHIYEIIIDRSIRYVCSHGRDGLDFAQETDVVTTNFPV
jgi:hypothetical protein